MIYKIAIASSDGNYVDRHFGAAEKFLIVSLDTEKETYDTVEFREVIPPCSGGDHSISAFDAVLEKLSDVSAVIAQRAGPGAERFLTENGIAVYQLPGENEQALCTLLEENRWEADRWLSHTKN